MFYALLACLTHNSKCEAVLDVCISDVFHLHTTPPHTLIFHSDIVNHQGHNLRTVNKHESAITSIDLGIIVIYPLDGWLRIASDVGTIDESYIVPTHRSSY